MILFPTPHFRYGVVIKPDRRDNPCKHIHLDYNYDSYGTQSKVEKLKNYCSSGYLYSLPIQ